MYIIKAVPIAKGVGTDALSYWSPKTAEPGDVVRVPLRKKTVGALVVSSEMASDNRAEIRSAAFVIKKLTNPKARRIISPKYWRTAIDTAKYFACSLGSALFDMAPQIVFSEYEKLPMAENAIGRPRPRDSYVLQKNDDDRFAHYKSLIRERFARKESVFMLMPTIEDIKKACSYFEKGIEPYTYVFHGGLGKKEIIQKWKMAVSHDHPVIIVATGAYLSIPRKDIGVIILEKENSRGYKSRFRPFIDFRHIAETYAMEIKADFIAGDSCLRVDTLYRREDGELAEYAPLSMRSLSTARDATVDMKSYKNAEHEIRIISDELVELARKNREENGLMFVFAGRRGLAPQTICADCETTLLCDACSSPLVLYGKESKFFLCNKCGKKFDAHQTCRACGGWRLTTLGIGTETIEAALSGLISDIKIFRLDKLSAPTHKKASILVEKWYNSPGSILIGTELALLYLDKQVDYSAVASLDSFFSIPDFRINEKIFSIILKMRSITSKQFLLQTRMPSSPVLAWGVKGNIMDFYRHEIENRKKFEFPPFSTFIKISSSGKKDEVLEEMEKLKTDLAAWRTDVFPAFIATERGDYTMHALMRLKKGEWVSVELLERLRSLPPKYAVNVDPESIL